MIMGSLRDDCNGNGCRRFVGPVVCVRKAAGEHQRDENDALSIEMGCLGDDPAFVINGECKDSMVNKARNCNSNTEQLTQKLRVNL